MMGEFEVHVALQNQPADHALAPLAIGQTHFDLVVDFTEHGVHDVSLPPVGYYAVGRGLVTEEETVNAVTALVGTFDKPKFFQFNADICAHQARGVQGCTRCGDSCDAECNHSQHQRQNHD